MSDEARLDSATEFLSADAADKDVRFPRVSYQLSNTARAAVRMISGSRA